MVTPPIGGVLLDTHALIWLDNGSPKLGPQSRQFADDALARRALFVSAAVFWEIAWAAEKRNLALRIADPTAWRLDLLAIGLREIPMNGEIAIASASFKKWDDDLFDCVFAATAIAHEMRLVTSDAELLKIKTRGLSLADAAK